MSWIREKSESSWVHKLCTRILKTGPMPKHVAFIMDGNRRFARKNSMDRAEGHLKGFDKLSETLQWCLDLGITEVTVYAFSIENFKRSKEEVDCLMELVRQKLGRLLEEKESLAKNGVCIRVLGNLCLLPRDIQELIAEAVNATKDHSEAILNVCLSYTSQDEICTAMREVAEGVKMGLIKESDIDERLLKRCLYTNRSPDPDLLVRTSGEVRLSDFLLWQSSYSIQSFMHVLWPEFSIWHLYAAVLHYQSNYPAIQAAKEGEQQDIEARQSQSDYQCMIGELGQDSCSTESIGVRSRLQQYAAERQQRIETFLIHVNDKREAYFRELCTRNTHISACA